MTQRRDVLKAGAAGAGLVAFATGYSETARKVVEGVAGSLAPKPANAAPNIHGRSLPPEFRVDTATGAVTPNPGQQVSYTMCLGCTTLCGVRVRVDKASGRVLRVAGNPYSPLSTDPHLPYETPVRESFAALSRHEEKGLAGRSTACGRGAAVLTQMDSSSRILMPLKRVGPRGAGRWEPISFAQLVREVVEGGDLFGEGHVDGLRALRSMEPIDPSAPELGPKVNQVAMLYATNEGRESFARRFMQQAFGSINFAVHGAYCSGSYRAGSGAAFGNLRQMPHAKPDLENAEFVIYCGTAPANAGNPFKRQGWQLAKGRRDGGLHYVVIDPVLGNSDSLAARDRGRWIPIRPTTDGALAMAMMRWMIENRRWNEAYLSQPSAKAAQKAGEPSFSNATHLVVAEPGHPREGLFLRASDIGLPFEGKRYGEEDSPVAADPTTGELRPAEAMEGPAVLLHDAVSDIGGQPLRLRSAADLLRESAFAHTLDEYAAICGIPAETIAGLAREFTSHGRKAAVNTHGGTMAGNGFASAFTLVTLNTLIGNLHWKGGTFQGGGGFPEAGPGSRYDLAKFDGMVQPRGVTLSRSNQAYERSSEFRRKQATGQAYPAERPWYAAGTPQLASEWLVSALDGYPYLLKALFVWGANPIYGVPGLRAQVDAALRDPKRLPLVVAIDPFINETGAYADYIVPDSLLYESWGWAQPWGGVPTRASTARWPVVEPKTAKTEAGEPIGLESFLIACATAMGLPGFGPRAIKDKDGNPHPLERAEDWYLRAGANIAFAGQSVPNAPEEELELVGLDRLRSALEATLKPEEWRKVAYVLARGGRYQDAAEAFQGERFAGKPMRMLHLYNEQVAAARSAVTGRRFPGVPGWTPPAFADGTAMRARHPEVEWPLLLVSQKSVLVNSYAIGADRLRGLKPDNPVAIHPEDAARLGIRSGERIRIQTPGGTAEATAILRRGVMRGVLAVEHGFGHRELGARAHEIGGVRQQERPGLATGVNLNDLGIPDPSRPGFSVWLDPVAGTAVRQGLPARIARA
ncbi:molybdopterin-dependent oxidoreductase [Roseomonas sp. E05]|uniref:molybdopterin dinucleotide binding domain-containing protein n=1 Tax=Roseomonas sp. E05 TaxID=3046310 RepID=UPI0024BAF148|nr:molybdopterin dinucleotide binding domain-containing protein [Roseomonas sp. E05]MDJ0391031.1 molybdopterin-dependent oxidoreductase [Roseomonas sp. E05]